MHSETIEVTVLQKVNVLLQQLRQKLLTLTLSQATSTTTFTHLKLLQDRIIVEANFQGELVVT